MECEAATALFVMEMAHSKGWSLIVLEGAIAYEFVSNPIFSTQIFAGDSVYDLIKSTLDLKKLKNRRI